MVSRNISRRILIFWNEHSLPLCLHHLPPFFASCGHWNLSFSTRIHKNKMHRRRPMNLAGDVIPVPKLPKYTSVSPNLLISSCGSKSPLLLLNCQRVKLTGHLTCRAHMSDPSSFFLYLPQPWPVQRRHGVPRRCMASRQGVGPYPRPRRRRAHGGVV